jgi:hypothetical protein
VQAYRSQGQQREGSHGETGILFVVYNKGGEQNIGIVEDTVMSEKEAREQAGFLREANRASAAGAARTPPIGAKASDTLRGILHGSRSASPSAWGDVKPDVKPPAKSVGDTLSGTSGGRGGLETVGDILLI